MADRAARQLLQDLRRGTTWLEPIPAPQPGEGELLVATRRSAVSPGTERMLLEFGRAGWIQKARSQPERVRQVLDKIRTDGLLPTLEAVRARLDEPVALGYCNAGRVVGGGARALALFPIGTRVATNAPHAELAVAGMHLAARIPDNVSDDEAAFTPLAAVALQAIRLAAPTLGETAVVIGAGLVGQFAIQLLIANGCRVVAMDLREDRLAMAAGFGATAARADAEGEAAALATTAGRGADLVIVAAATPSDEPLRTAARLSRPGGRIVLAGVTGMQVDRNLFYHKELRFQVSCSYGPGRYDAAWETGLVDYPIGQVRWTAQRNFEAVLELMAAGRLTAAPMVSHRWAFDRAPEAYDTLAAGAGAAMGIVLEYMDRQPGARSALLVPTGTGRGAVGRPAVGVIGAGNFSRRVLLPLLAAQPCRLRTVVARRGTAAALAARRVGAEQSASEAAAVLEDRELAGIVIATRHDSHARMAAAGLAAGRHVLVEKPLATRLEDLALVVRALQARGAGTLMVGFNRRFAPLVVRLRDWLGTAARPLCLHYHVNAGMVKAGSWVQDPQEGGGRLLGECCHFIDLLRHLCGAPIVRVHATAARDAAGAAIEDHVAITLAMADGSLGTITYWANGPARLPKERLVVYTGGGAAELENYRRLALHGPGGVRRHDSLRQDKGHRDEVRRWVAESLVGGRALLPADELVEVTLATLAAAAAVRGAGEQHLDEWRARLAALVEADGCA